MTTEVSGPPRWRKRVLWLCAFVALWLAGVEGDRHLRAAAALLRFGGHPESGLASYRDQEVQVEQSVVAARPMRTYRPARNIGGQIILAHGMHPLGYDEPRLVALARALAASGVVVHTPDQPHLKDLSLDPRTASELAETARALARCEGRGTLGVMGISFAGGLALRAAADDPGAFAYVVAVGAHHDLARVVRWFAGEDATGPAGQRVDYEPHPYGVGLLVNAEPERFFPAEEATLAGQALDLALHNHRQEAEARARGLSAASQGLLQEARHPGRPTTLAPQLLELLRDRASTFAAASPAGALRNLETPVMVLHGASDPIVPPTEAYHLAAELPDGAQLLVSDALRHAETADTGLRSQLELVHFMARVLAASE